MDGGGFSELAERHRHELRVHCYRMTGSFTDAEDLVQETLLRAWKHRATLTDPSALRAWLYRIATNVCLDMLAAPSRSREIVMTADSGGGDARSPLAEITWLQPFPDHLLDEAERGPEAVAIARETVELAFLAVIQHLPARQRAVLILRDVLGWPADQAAAALEMSVPAAKSALQRARETLRTTLPTDRHEWGSAAGEREREVLRRYIAASQSADVDELATLLRDDARQAMPPANLLFDGRQAIVTMWREALAGGHAGDEWRTVEIAANRQLAVANYARRPGESRFTAVNIDVLRFEDGLIAEITTFGADLLPAFGLETTL
ncbi:RNA polymerase subunit sigma-70 [Nonomuraea sp. NPDC050663]|uniref:RNA polymerase subunit sigma-70 n=1 Tax=Nonomuraea sp. NPDC050663 TaxID=3364370 RepID=UPI0037A2DC06